MDAVVKGIAASDKEVWSRVRDSLRRQVGEDVFTSWFAQLELVDVANRVVYLTVPTRFLKSWLDQHYLKHIQDAFLVENWAVARVTISVRQVGVRQVPTAPLIPQTSVKVEPPAVVVALPKPASSNDSFEGSPIDRRLVFDTFHVGPSNAMAHTAAMQVVQMSATERPVYNPLFIHAAVGLGKTHLLQATTQAVSASVRQAIYLTAERFMYSFVAALKTQTALDFKENIRAVDVFIVDDLQFLNGKQTQQEFCHTLDALIDAGKQVIVAADRVPQDLEMFDERMQSRLAGGLVVEIGALDESLRLKVLESRVQAARIHTPGFTLTCEVLECVVRNITTNGRDLEGAVNRLLAHTSLSGGPLDVEAAETAIRDLIRTNEPKKVKIEDIQRLVANHYNVSRADILSSRRTAMVVRPRQVAMYLAKVLTLRSLPEIGRRFGGRDHTTVLHAVRKIEVLVAKDNSLAGEIEHLKLMLQQ